MGLAFDLAYRTARSAGAVAKELGDEYVDISVRLRSGDILDALERFEKTADRLERFMTFVVLMSELLVDTSPSVGATLADYGRRVLAVAGRIHDELEAQDLVAVTLALEHGLAATLADYEDLAWDVERAFEPPLLVA